MSGPGSGRRAATVAPPPARTALAAVYTSASETAARTPLAVAGRLPAYLRGSLLRNGAGTFELAHAGGGGTQLAHWFDAVSMLHRFEVDGRGEGGVWYTSRTTAPGMVRAAASVRKESWEGGIHFGVQDPCKGIFGKAMALWRPETRDPDGGRTSNVGVTVETVPGLGLVSRTDMTVMFRIDEETLEAAEFASWATVDVVAGAGKGEPLVGEMSAAHGEYDASTKEYFNYSYKLGGGATSSYKVFCVGADGAASVLATVPYRPTYCHSLALTDSYVVLVLYPLHIGVLRMLLNKSLLGSMDFDAAGETRFFVISRAKGGVVATYAAAPFWCFHTINAWETPAGDVHIDLCHYENADVCLTSAAPSVAPRCPAQATLTAALPHRTALPADHRPAVHGEPAHKVRRLLRRRHRPSLHAGWCGRRRGRRRAVRAAARDAPPAGRRLARADADQLGLRAARAQVRVRAGTRLFRRQRRRAVLPAAQGRRGDRRRDGVDEAAPALLRGDFRGRPGRQRGGRRLAAVGVPRRR